MNQDRYDKQPFLLLLELYVLHCINKLSRAELELLDEMTPQLQMAHQKEGTWKEIIADISGYGNELPRLARKQWREKRIEARKHNITLSAEDFAVQFVDEFFIVE